MTEIIVEHSFAILGPKPVWPEPTTAHPKKFMVSPVSITFNQRWLYQHVYKSMAVVPEHVWCTLCKVRSKVFCHFHPFFHCLFLAACGACKNRWILDGKYCQNRSRYPKQRYQTLANLQQTRSCTRKRWPYLLPKVILKTVVYCDRTCSSKQQVETTGDAICKCMHWAL